MFSNFGAGDTSMSFLSGIGTGGVVVNNAYGSFYDITTQTTAGNENIAMKLGNTDTTATNGFTIQNNTFGFPTRILAQNSGLYNLQFSAQLHKTSGGGATQIYIWFAKQGVALPDSNTSLTLANNGDLLVAAWNYFVPLNAGQYVEIFWRATASTVEIQYNTTPVGIGLPAIPSVIVTMQKIAEL